MSIKNTKFIESLPHKAINPNHLNYEREEFWNDERSTIVKCVNDTQKALDENIRKIIIDSAVKIGKKELAIRIAMLIKKLHGKKVVHLFFCSLQSKDTKTQIDDISPYFESDGEMRIFIGSSGKRSLLKLLDKEFSDKIFKHKDIAFVIHGDECDYGSGEKQTLGKVLKYLSKYNNIHFIGFSATPFDAIHAISNPQETRTIKLEKPPNYRDFEFFNKHELVIEASEFLDKDGIFTDQGKEALRHLLSDHSSRVFGVVRIVSNKDEEFHYSDLKNDSISLMTQLANYCKEFDKANQTDSFIHSVFADQNNPYQFNPEAGFGYDSWLYHANACLQQQAIGKNHRTLIFMSHVCSRSTEVGFHPFLSFWHEVRGKSSTKNTVEQSQFRVNHYKINLNNIKYKNYPIPVKDAMKSSLDSFNGECKFLIFGDKSVFTGETDRGCSRVRTISIQRQIYSNNIMIQAHSKKELEIKIKENQDWRIQEYSKQLNKSEDEVRRSIMKGFYSHPAIMGSTRSFSETGSKSVKSTVNWVQCIVEKTIRGSKQTEVEDILYQVSCVHIDDYIPEFNKKGEKIIVSEEYNNYLKNAIDSGKLNLKEGRYFAIVPSETSIESRSKMSVQYMTTHKSLFNNLQFA